MIQITDPSILRPPEGIGRVACAAVLEFRHHDGSNQLGNLAQGAYSDWTHYCSANQPGRSAWSSAVTDPDRWQPLTYINASGDVVVQRFMIPLDITYIVGLGDFAHCIASSGEIFVTTLTGQAPWTAFPKWFFPSTAANPKEGRVAWTIQPRTSAGRSGPCAT